MQPLECAEFSALLTPFAPFEDHPTIAVAVSGGADSMALLLLMHEWARAQNGQIIALTVDHGLRANSHDEALQVQNWCKARNIEHHILSWLGHKPGSGIMKAAREARYDLLQLWCRDHSILHLAVAHHKDDQAETILMRFAKGSGLDGLAGMKSEKFLKHIRIIRPLLSVAKERLIATCKAHHQVFIDDPSNQNARYARARLRTIEPLLKEEGFSSDRMMDLAMRAQNAQQALEQQVYQALAQTATFTAPKAWLSTDLFSQYPAEIQYRALQHILTTIGASARPPKYAQICSLAHGIKSANFSGRTLLGCLMASKKGKIEFEPEKTV